MYTLLSDLGRSVDYRSQQADPLTYCLYPTYDSQWIHGSTSVNLLNTPYCDPCQNMMADRCSKQWDEACDVYVNNNCDTSWPNTGAIDTMSQKRAQHFLQYSPTSGDNLIRNAAERYFFTYPGANPKHTPFDPNVADSPVYTTYSVDSLSPVWKLHPRVIQQKLLHDGNPHVQLMLNHPKACFDLLARLHAIQKTQPHHFQSALNRSRPTSQLEGFLQANTKIFSQFHNSFS